MTSPMPTPALAPALAPAPAADNPNEDVVVTYSFNTGLMVLLIILWSSLGHKIAARTKYLSEWSAACVMGLLTGLAVLISQRYLSADVVHQLLTFNPADFFTYLLPPIILYAGLSVKKKHFFRNFGTIAALGIAGTYISFALIALVLFGFAQLPNILNLSDCLALGVIFAATDSVAVLQVLRQDRAPLLYSLVFGEGVINDATAVALLRAVTELGSGDLAGWMVLTILAKFLYLFLASLALGLTFGLGTSFLMKTFPLNSVPQEVALIGLLAYLSYLAGELAGLSGIVTLFCCAVALSHYALHNITAPARVTVVRAFQTLSYVAEGVIFIYVGMDTLDPPKWRGAVIKDIVWLFCVLLVLTMLGRAAFVFPIGFLHNATAREAIPLKHMVVIWWAGLIRGAVSVALVYYYFDPAGRSEDSHGATLIATTLVLVMFSILIFGAATKPALDALLGPQDGPVAPRSDPALVELLPRRFGSSSDTAEARLLPSRAGQGSTGPSGGGLRRTAWAGSTDSLVSTGGDLDDEGPRMLRQHEVMLNGGGPNGGGWAELAPRAPLPLVPKLVAPDPPPRGAPAAGLPLLRHEPLGRPPRPPSSLSPLGPARLRAATAQPPLGPGAHAASVEALPPHTATAAGPATELPAWAAFPGPGPPAERPASRATPDHAAIQVGPATAPTVRMGSHMPSSHAGSEASVGDAADSLAWGDTVPGNADPDAAAGGELLQVGPDSSGSIHRWWDSFDRRYMRPVFGGAAPDWGPPAVPCDGEVAGAAAVGLPHGEPGAAPPRLGLAHAWGPPALGSGALEAQGPGRGREELEPAGGGAVHEADDGPPNVLEPWRPPSPPRTGLDRRLSL